MLLSKPMQANNIFQGEFMEFCHNSQRMSDSLNQITESSDNRFRQVNPTAKRRSAML